MGATVRVSKTSVPDLEVVGHGDLLIRDESEYGDDSISEYVGTGTLEGVGPASLSSLRRALLSWGKAAGRDPAVRMAVNLADVAEEDFDPTEGFYDSPSLALDGERLLVRVATTPSTPPDPAALRRLFEPFLRSHKASCDVVVEMVQDFYSRRGGEYCKAEVLIEWPTRGRTVADAWAFGEKAHALLWAGSDGELDQSNALDLLRGGMWDVLRDQPESDWLDAKRDPYDRPNDETWKKELAKDVAAFANRPGGGMIVIGMETKPEGDLEIIKEPKEFKLSRVNSSQYRKIVSQWAYPEVTDLQIEKIEGSEPGKGIVVLVVPSQPPPSFPFVVQGPLVEDKVLGPYVLVPFRRADETVSWDAATIHARLRLGEQVLAGEKHTRPNS